MTGPSAVVLGGLLVGLFLLVVAALVWQESKQRSTSEPPAYVIDDAVSFVGERLDPEIKDRLRGGGVQRIIEWEVHHLQGLAQQDRSMPVQLVAGGTDASIDYIVSRIAEVNGATYDRDDVASVLALEAEYLLALGIVGAPVESDETINEQQEEGDAP